MSSDPAATQPMTARLIIPAIMKTPFLEIDIDVPLDLSDDEAARYVSHKITYGMRVELVPDNKGE